MVINLSEQYSLISDWIAEIRDQSIQNDRMRFRRNLERIGEVAALEISRKLPFETRDVQTPLGISTSKVLKEQPVLATILRAGLPLPLGLDRDVELVDEREAGQDQAQLGEAGVDPWLCTVEASADGGEDVFERGERVPDRGGAHMLDGSVAFHPHRGAGVHHHLGHR